MDEIWRIPPVTRTLVLGVAAVTLPVLLGVAPAYMIVWLPNRLIKRLELWRAVTPFLYGGKGLPLLFDTFMLYRSARGIEESHFQLRTAQFAWALVLIGATIIATNYPLGSVVFFRPLLLAITHLWAQTHQSQSVSLFGFIQIPAPYFPFALAGLDLVQGGPTPALQSLTGIASAHLFYYISEVLPRQNGGTGGSPLDAPSWFASLFGEASGGTYRSGGGWAMPGRGSGGQRLGARPGSNAPERQAPTTASAGSGRTGASGVNVRAAAGTAAESAGIHRWGQGQRLGSD